MEKTAAAYTSSFLTEKLIAYIGNKRRLLPFIGSVIDRIRGETPGMTSFLDLFAGSGSVSRLARSKGLTVHANDWEYYSYVLNRPHLMLTPEDAERLFTGHGGIDAILERINTIPFLPSDDEYLAAYYAPADDENPDIINERMFYTNHNARRLDAMRTEIERLKPELSDDAYFYLIAAIVYEAATHANTSGVFKGFHAGFGGAGKDALTRIMGDVSLTPLPLIDAPRGTVTQDDANSIIRSLSSRCDIVYLDPPYNQHQYGSNYHLLNTVALWDKPAVNRSIFIDGKKTNKSAIRSDWKRTRSPYCSRATAAAAFADLIRHIDARYILVSYSSDGFIPREEIADILNTRGGHHGIKRVHALSGRT